MEVGRRVIGAVQIVALTSVYNIILELLEIVIPNMDTHMFRVNAAIHIKQKNLRYVTIIRICVFLTFFHKKVGKLAPSYIVLPNSQFK